MKVLVYAHRLEIGGTQTNAIELAARLRDSHGHSIVFHATPGPACELAEARSLDVVPAPDTDRHPSPARFRALERLVKAERPDLVHVWDWPQCFDSYASTQLLRQVPTLCTVMGMVVPSFIPRHLDTTFGTELLRDEARRKRIGRADLLEPPVDVEFNAPGRVDPHAVLATWGVRPEGTVLAIVSRLVDWMKLEGVVEAIRAVDQLEPTRKLTLLIVGDGPARPDVEKLAHSVNTRHGREVIVVPGPLADPRPAYAAADIMLGMGGSALRSMAFAKPLLVLGERGFSAVLDESTLPLFLHQGFYGVGDGSPPALLDQLGGLLGRPADWSALGQLGRQVVERRFSLDAAAARLNSYYAATSTRQGQPVRAIGEAVRTAAMVLGRALVPSRSD